MNRPITRSVSRQNRQNQTNIYTRGYHVFKNKIPIHPTVLTALKKQVDSKMGGPIFNGAKNDKRRIQSNLSRNPTVLHEFIDDLETTIYELLLAESPLSFSNWVILKSTPGCERQLPHTDYDPELIRRTPAHIPLLVLVSIMPDTYLDLWDINGKHERVSMDAGDILIFRADTVHAGSAYQRENVRIHVYLDSPVIQRIHNRVWFSEKQMHHYTK
jgi:hypothetical protein